MKINKKIIVIVAGIALALIICLALGAKKVKYITKPIVQESITQYVEASGTIKPINTIQRFFVNEAKSNVNTSLTTFNTLLA